MSDSREVTATSHDRHDPMLVAALAAGDLAGAERDQAIALTRSCTECATLHADLLAIARATSRVAPPYTAPQRDFRLTPAQAASLRRTGWRRFVPAGAARSSRTRPLGVALATFGLAGLLIGTIPLNLGSTSAGAVPAAAPADRESVTSNGAGGAGSDSSVGGQALGGPVASAAASQAAAPAPPVPAASGVTDAASPGAEVLHPVASAASGDFGVAKNPSPAAAGGGTTDQASSPGREPPSVSAVPPAPAGPSPLVIVSIVALLLGAVLLVVGGRRGDRTV